MTTRPNDPLARRSSRSLARGLVLGLVLGLAVLGLAGCHDRARLWDSPLAVMGPYKLSSQVLWLDATRGQAFAVEPGATTPEVRAAATRRNASFALVAPGREELLVLTAGKEAVYRDQLAEDPGLSVLRAPPGHAPELVRFYPLSGAFDRLAVSADGAFAVAYYSSAEGSGGVFRNPNEVALLDLTRPAESDNPRLRTVRSFGSVPLGVVFSPPLAIPAGGVKRTLAVVLAERYLTFLDLTHPERSEITVPLAKPESTAVIRPRQVSFGAATSTVIVRAEGASDLFSLSLLPQQASGPSENDYLPSINQPSAGRTPLDMVLFSDGGKDLILTANATQDLALIDAATSEFSIIPVGEAVDSILAVPADHPTLALVYSASSPAPRLHFVELKGLAAGLTKNLTRRNLDRPVHQLVAMPGGTQALVVHDDKRTVVSVLDLVDAHHTVSPIQGTLPLGSFDFLESSEGTFLVGVSAGLSRLGLLDLANLHPTELRLDQSPRRVLAVGDAILVEHDADEGVVTVVPGARAGRDASRVLWGVFLGGLLDGELED